MRDNIENLKKGDIFTNGGTRYKCLERLGDVVFHTNTIDSPVVSITPSAIGYWKREGYYISESSFAPKIGDTYFFVSSQGKALSSEYKDNDVDKFRQKNKNMFASKELAESTI